MTRSLRDPASIPLVIPAFQPTAALVEVVRGVASHDPDRLLHPIVVVDDGSGGAFRDVFEAVAASPRTTVVTRAANGGQGAALKTALGHVAGLLPSFRGIVTADADGQHAPGDIVEVARALARNPEALVLGVRQFGPGVPVRCRLGNLITRRVVGWAAGLHVSDTQTGLRGRPRACCDRDARNPADGFEFNLATLLDAAATGCRVIEVPIATIYEPGNRTSHFRPLRDSARIVRVLVRHGIHPPRT